ncbi:AI-2E family transporter [Dissulfurispira thermophila]|uniref:AI-2E family transporter n=1 Tax=Dissulfurispira thermophila TaxID=2715679 RepID=A0A7G1H2T8_9BACT|nr:AI-2E family transporter [Dissulfurispira thermophila]BCB96499.1 AI-2E family transporter [Dissulfurispira thermophila]
MAVNRFYFITLTFFVGVLGYLSYLILKPFLSPIAWAIVLSLVFYPVYAFLLRYIKLPAVASFITLGIILIIILGPFSYLSVLLVKELKHISDYMEGGRFETLQSALGHPVMKAMVDRITSLFNITEAEMDKAIIDGISNLGKDLIGRITKGMGDVVTVALNFIFMAFAIFFLLKDGTEFLKKIRDYMPFSEEQKDRLATQIRDIIISTVYGGVVVAIVQGLIAGLTFYILEIPSPVVWGMATSIASFIPLIGAFAIWGPATVYLFLHGAVLKGIALAIIGVFGISLIDNVLKPIIIGGRTKMPILAIFFSVLGGIKLFGLIGLVMGPLVLAIFVSVVEIFRNIETNENRGIS